MKKLFSLLISCSFLSAANQTSNVTTPLPEDSLPFTIEIETSSFTLPAGIQAFATATEGGYWIFISGRTSGMHTFSNVGNNFPPTTQNRVVYLVDPASGKSWQRSLEEASSGLTEDEVDALSVTAAQFFQKPGFLYFVGGYGINRATGEMETKSTLTRIDLNKMIGWVQTGAPTLRDAISQVSDPYLQVTGGSLFQDNPHNPFLLILGQNFAGLYRSDSNGIYTRQIRQFWLLESNEKLYILPNLDLQTEADYRRRDLNIVPILKNNQTGYSAYSGVFTTTNGIWTKPITIKPDGSSIQGSKNDFKQGMNNYNCPVFGLYSVINEEMFSLFSGGISFGFFSGGTFTTSGSFPFINQVTTVRIDKENNYTQHIMNNEYPVILSTGSNPGNTLLFGAEAQFVFKPDVATFRNGVIDFDNLPKGRTQVGYIVGGIMSTVPNTSSASDSTASPYVFNVIINKK